GEERPAVALRDDARVENDDAPRVGARADEAPESLFEPDDGAREGVVGEGVAAALLEQVEPGLGEGPVGRLEGQAGDDDVAERVAAHVDALPEGGDAEEDGAGLVAEALEDRGA